MRRFFGVLIGICISTCVWAQPHTYEDPKPIFYVYGPGKAIQIDPSGVHAPYGREDEVKDVPTQDLYDDDASRQALCLAGSFINDKGVETYVFLISTSKGNRSKGWFVIGTKEPTGLIKYMAKQYMEDSQAHEEAREVFRSPQMKQVIGIRMHPGRAEATVEPEELDLDIRAATRYLYEKLRIPESEK